VLGETLGNFRVLRLIGVGGMGMVYYAQHVLIGRKAAIKVLQPEFSADPEFVNRFFNEARSTAQIRHPGLVEVFDFGFHPSRAAYLVMEYLEGETLGARLARERRLAPWFMSTVLRQVANAVGAAHHAGIVHRDLKPDNVFLVPERGAMGGIRVKILDFGVAKVKDAASLGANPMQTQAGSMLGTPHYMSPEQCRGAAQADYRSDIYAIGCILFEMLVGRKAFDAPGLGELLAAHQRLPAPTLAAFDPSLPRELDVLLGRMLAKRPEDRPQSLEEVEATLDDLAARYGWDAMWSRATGSMPIVAARTVSLSSPPVPQPPEPSLAKSPSSPSGVASEVRTAAVVPRRPKRRRTGVWATAALAVLGIGGGTLFLASRGSGEPGTAVSVKAAGEPDPAPAPASPPLFGTPLGQPVASEPPPAQPAPAQLVEAHPAPAQPAPAHPALADVPAPPPPSSLVAAPASAPAPATAPDAPIAPPPPHVAPASPPPQPAAASAPPAPSPEAPKPAPAAPKPRKPRKPAVDL